MEFICPKCGYGDINILYVAKNKTISNRNLPDNYTDFAVTTNLGDSSTYILNTTTLEEFFDCSCKRCKYKWFQKIKGVNYGN
jgi:predicted nucleic-acid-binding Zn-ribbon protein